MRRRRRRRRDDRAGGVITAGVMMMMMMRWVGVSEERRVFNPTRPPPATTSPFPNRS